MKDITKKIDIIHPNIFPNNVVSGVTCRNVDNFTPHGFSINQAKILNKKEVQKNRQLLAEQLSIPLQNLIFQNQIHSDIVDIAYDVSATRNLPNSDAMILPPGYNNIALNISIADCVAILLYDTKKHIVAGIHSGWKGSVSQITIKTIHSMKVNFNTNPEDLLAYISPAASGENYEVGAELAHLFNTGLTPLPNGKFLLDNKKVILEQLLFSGLKLENIEVSNLCTISDYNLHSYRRDKELSGRMSAFIMLKEHTL